MWDYTKLTEVGTAEYMYIYHHSQEKMGFVTPYI